MSEPFHVSERDIPSELTVHLGAKERATFAEVLTNVGIAAEDAGDLFEWLLKDSFKLIYEKQTKKELASHASAHSNPLCDRCVLSDRRHRPVIHP